MNYDEYKHELNLLQTEFDNKKEQLYSKYAFANNLVKIGDNVTDHFHTIKVESIKVHGHQVCFHYAIDYSHFAWIVTIHCKNYIAYPFYS